MFGALALKSTMPILLLIAGISQTFLQLSASLTLCAVCIIVQCVYYLVAGGEQCAAYSVYSCGDIISNMTVHLQGLVKCQEGHLACKKHLQQSQ